MNDVHRVIIRIFAWVFVVGIIAAGIYYLGCRSIVPVTVQQFQIECTQTGETRDGKQKFQCVQTDHTQPVNAPEQGKGDDTLEGRRIFHRYIPHNKFALQALLESDRRN